jgi:hypothetical protein
MKVKDHMKFRLFDYESDMTNKNFQLGDVVTKLEMDNEGEIGVVIQLHPDGDIRTDMFGNSGSDQVRLSTFQEILDKRSELLIELEVDSSIEANYKSSVELLYKLQEKLNETRTR